MALATSFGRRGGGKVKEMVFTLAAGPMLAYLPSLFDWHTPCAGSTDPLWRVIGDPHPHDREAGAQAIFGSLAPTDLAPLCLLQHGMGDP
jgi:hypothetical protein